MFKWKWKERKISPRTAPPLAGMNLKCWATQEKAETVRFLCSRFYHSALLLRVRNDDFPSEFSTLWVYNFFRSPGSVGEGRRGMKNWWNNSIIERRSFVCKALRTARRAGRCLCPLGGKWVFPNNKESRHYWLIVSEMRNEIRLFTFSAAFCLIWVLFLPGEIFINLNQS